MERTGRLFRITVQSLPSARDATLVHPDADGTVDEEKGAEVHVPAVNQSSPTERRLSGRAGIQIHHVTRCLEGGTGRQEMHTVAEHGETTGRAASDRAVPENVAAVDESDRTDRGLAHYRISGDRLSGARRHELHTVAEHQELTGRAASEHPVPKNVVAVDGSGRTDRGLVHHRVSGDRLGRAGLQETHTVAENQELTSLAASDSVPVEGGRGGLAGSTSSGNSRYDQYMDLYLYGRPVSDVWETLWIRLPLVFHDMELLSIREYIASCRKNSGFSLDLTNEINSVIDKHPGPISSFRIDCCTWTGGSETLGNWLNILSAKRVEEIMVINKLMPTDTVFPVNMLQGPNLTMLCIAFMDIPSLCFGAFNYCTLDTLHITGCTYCGKGLSSLIADCICLRCLILGCSHEDISITSQSLMSIQIWNCTAYSFRIDYAPKLLTLATGIRPKRGLQFVMLSVNSVEALAEINCLMLPFHDLSIRSASVIEGVVALKQVRRVRLGIQFGVAHQRDGLVSILKRMPRLTHLTLLTVEDSATDEEFDGSTSALGSLSCVRMCLHSLKVEGFRGARTEVSVIASIISNAGKLAEVVLETCLFIQAAIEAAMKLERCPRASTSCHFSLTGLS